MISLAANHIHAPFCSPLAEVCGLSGLPSSICPNIRLVAERLLSIDTENLETGGCSWLLTSNLYRLPFIPTAYQGAQLGAEAL